MSILNLSSTLVICYICLKHDQAYKMFIKECYLNNSLITDYLVSRLYSALFNLVSGSGKERVSSLGITETHARTHAHARTNARTRTHGYTPNKYVVHTAHCIPVVGPACLAHEGRGLRGAGQVQCVDAVEVQPLAFYEGSNQSMCLRRTHTHMTHNNDKHSD